METKPFLLNSTVGMRGTLHRITAMQDSHGQVYGLTYRIGRHLPGGYVMLNCFDLLSTFLLCYKSPSFHGQFATPGCIGVVCDMTNIDARHRALRKSQHVSVLWVSCCISSLRSLK